jgi:hypothetical protein
MGGMLSGMRTLLLLCPPPEGMQAAEWIALSGVVVALCALAASIWAVVYNRSAARSGSKSADAAARSAQAADASAEAAARSAAEAAALTRIERERDHERLFPAPPPEIPTEIGGDEPRLALFGTFTVPRDYRVRAHAVVGAARTPISLPVLARANQPVRFFIEHWSEGRSVPQTQMIEFEFWPPAPGDDGEDWSCPCDRPHGEQEGHWRWRVPPATPPQAPGLDWV